MHDVHTHMYTLAQVLLLQVVVSEDAIVIAEVHARFHIEGGCPGIPSPSPEFTKINPSFLSPPSLPPPPHLPLPPPPLPPPLLPTLLDYFPSI